MCHLARRRVHGGSTGKRRWFTLIALSVSVPSYAGFMTLIDNGPSSNRLDMVFIGDGYTAGQQSTLYLDHVDAYLSHMFDGPLDGYFFGRYRNFFNVHVVESISPQAGADIPNQGIYVNTLLDATYQQTTQGSTNDRLLTINNAKANAHTNAALAGSGIVPDALLATVNSTKYGGSGGVWATWAGGNASANEVALHELGHSFAQLADEYGGNPTTYSHSEPWQVNVTADPALGKWDRWLGYDDPDTTVGPIGYFEGGQYYDSGIWRPASNGKMRSLGRSFDAVSREAFINAIYNDVDPLDDWLDNASPVIDPGDGLWVQTIDPAVFAVDWWVDGQPILGDGGEWFDLSTLTPCEYEITAHVYDRILDHTGTGASLDWWRLEHVSELAQRIVWEVSLTDAAIVLGDFNGNGSVEQGDLDLVLNNWGTPATGLPSTWVNQTPTSGLVDQAELDEVLNHWGEASLPDFRGVVVPEPALAILGGGIALSLRHRRRMG